MQVRCPHCSTAYQIPPLARPRRLRCAQCDTEWREMPPVEDPDAAELAIPPAPAGPETVLEETRPAPVAPDPSPVAPLLAADALCAPVPPHGRKAMSGAGMVWLVLWVTSLLLVAGGLAASWHARLAIEHVWPESLWLFRLVPAGLPG